MMGWIFSSGDDKKKLWKQIHGRNSSTLNSFFFFFPCSMLTAVHRWVSKSKLLCTSSKQLKHTSLNIYIYIYHPLSIQMSREFALQVQRLEHILRITVVEKQKTYFWGIKNHQYNVWWFSNSNDLRDKHKSNLIVTKILFSG